MSAVGIAAGAVADNVVGDPARGHPVAAFGEAADRLERRLWRDCRAAGAFHTVACVAPVAIGVALAARGRCRTAVTAAVVASSLGMRSLAQTGDRLADALAVDDCAAARGILPSLCGRDPHVLDAKGLCRAAVESVAENASDAVVATLCWAAAGGPTGAAVHRTVNVLDAMVGHPTERYARFGWAAARADDALGWLPARLTVALIALCAPVVGGSSIEALAVARRDGGCHPSPNAGRCEAAMAGALGVRLGGVTEYSDRVEQRGPFGDGPPPEPADLRRAVRLLRAVGAAATLLAIAVATAGDRRREVRR